MNPANFEAWQDPEGGHWFRMKKKEVEGITWRPVDMKMTEDGQITFDVEYFEGPGAPAPTEENSQIFENLVKSIILTLVSEAAAEDQVLAEQYKQESHEANGLLGADGKPLV